MARVAVVGGGWAGLACAHALDRAGHLPTVFETGPRLGGRARTLPASITEREGFALPLENGQHLLLGAYRHVADWLAQRGLDPDDYFLRTPLRWTVAPHRLSLRLASLPPPWNGLLGLIRAQGWRASTRWRVLRALRQLRQQGWRCPPEWSWEQWLDAAGQDADSRDTWWHPLCVAVCNTAPQAAQALGLLTVLRTVLEGPGHYSDLWFPRRNLSGLAEALLGDRIERRLRHTVREVHADAHGISVDGITFDALVLAAPPPISGRLLEQLGLPIDPAGWPEMRFHSITTCYLQLAAPYRLPQPMIGLIPDPERQSPGQWVFDRGIVAGQTLEHAELAVVISQAHTLHGHDAEALATACWRQLAEGLDPALPPLQRHFTITDKRSTFAFTPALRRPSVSTADPRVMLAGDWTAGPFPATLEGAVRAGFEAAARLHSRLGPRG